MKSGYNNTILEEGGGGELKPLTNANAGIPETGGSRITKKHLVLVSLGLVITGVLMGHLTNTHHSGLKMSQESTAAQPTDFKELVDSKEGVSTLHLLEPNESGQGIVFGMNVSLIPSRLSIAICFVLIY